MKTLAIVNQKGGSGKTTLAVHLAYAASSQGLKTLLVDFDRQASLSISFPSLNEGNNNIIYSSYLFSSEQRNLKPEILTKTLSILRANDSLSMIGNGVEGLERRPAQHLKKLAEDFDFCIIDTPGAIGFNPPMTVAALIAANACVCPFSVGLYEAQGLADLWAYIRAIKSPKYNPKLRIIGLIPSMIDTTSKEEKAALEEITRVFGKLVLPQILGRRQAVKQAIMRKRPVWRCTKGAGHLKAADEWKEACKLILSGVFQ